MPGVPGLNIYWNFRFPGQKDFLKQMQFSNICIFQLNIILLQFAV